MNHSKHSPAGFLDNITVYWMGYQFEEKKYDRKNAALSSQKSWQENNFTYTMYICVCYMY